MPKFNLLILMGGFIAYLVSIGVSTALVLLFFRLNVRLIPGQKIVELFHWRPSTDGETSRPPSPAPAIALGAATLSQAYLLRHVVFVIMTMVRDFLVERGDSLFANGSPVLPILKLIAESLLLVLILSALSVLSIWLAGWLFSIMTGELREMEEILHGNVAVAVLFAFVLFAITAILNQGIEDVAQALVPYGRSGVVRML